MVGLETDNFSSDLGCSGIGKGRGKERNEVSSAWTNNSVSDWWCPSELGASSIVFSALGVLITQGTYHTGAGLMSRVGLEPGGGGDPASFWIIYLVEAAWNTVKIPEISVRVCDWRPIAVGPR